MEIFRGEDPTLFSYAMPQIADVQLQASSSGKTKGKTPTHKRPPRRGTRNTVGPQERNTHKGGIKPKTS